MDQSRLLSQLTANQAPVANSSRRRFLKQNALALAALFAGGNLASCANREPPIRIATNNWPGYAMLHLAGAQGYLKQPNERIIEMPSTTACLQALAAGSIEGAGLTLDETISAIADGIDLRVVAVLDVSNGADVLLAKPSITSLSDLKGHRIGVEQTAVGAVMLSAALQHAGLRANDVKIVSTPVNEHRARFISGEVDALITFEPVTSQLAATGARKLFSSANIPGQIVDVLALRASALDASPNAVRALVSGHFRALADWRNKPATVAPFIAEYLGLNPEQVGAVFEGLDLPDKAANQQWLKGAPSKLESTAASLMNAMLNARLLSSPVPVAGLANSHFLDEA